MSKATGSREFREQIVGKCISGVIARPGREGEPPMVMMLRFDDGSVVEFVSPRSDRLLRRAMAADGRGEQCGTASDSFQLPLSGLAA